MKPSLGAATSSLLCGISRNLPAGNHSCPNLPELLLAGLALRRGISPFRVKAFLPEMSSIRLRLGLSKALSHPYVSSWYFASLEVFESRFELLCEIYMDEVESLMEIDANTCEISAKSSARAKTKPLADA